MQNNESIRIQVLELAIRQHSRDVMGADGVITTAKKMYAFVTGVDVAKDALERDLLARVVSDGRCATRIET